MEMTCHRCGKAFEARRRDARYCSPRCRTAASRELAREAQGLPRPQRRPLVTLMEARSQEVAHQIRRLHALLTDERWATARGELQLSREQLVRARAELDEVIDALGPAVD